MEYMNTNAGNYTTSSDYNDYGAEYAELRELRKSLRIMSCTVYSLVFVLGVLGNGFVIWVTGFKMKQTVSTVWCLSLAVADFRVAAFLPLTITETALDGHWPFGTFMCKISFFFLPISLYASVYILMVISVDRCACAVWPVWAQKRRSARKAACVSLGVWVLAMALSVPAMTDTVPPHYEEDIIICFPTYGLPWSATNQSWMSRFVAMVFTQFFMGFVIPFTVMVSCYSVIIYRLRRNRSLVSQSGRHFKTIAAVIAAFFLCWAPIHIVKLAVLWVKSTPLIEKSVTLFYVINIGGPIATCLVTINSCLNPLLYLYMLFMVPENPFTEELPRTNSSTNLASNSQETALSETQV